MSSAQMFYYFHDRMMFDNNENQVISAKLVTWLIRVWKTLPSPWHRWIIFQGCIFLRNTVCISSLGSHIFGHIDSIAGKISQAFENYSRGISNSGFPKAKFSFNLWIFITLIIIVLSPRVLVNCFGMESLVPTVGHYFGYGKWCLCNGFWTRSVFCVILIHWSAILFRSIHISSEVNSSK